MTKRVLNKHVNNGALVRNNESFDCAPFDRLMAVRTGIEQGISNDEDEIAA